MHCPFPAVEAQNRVPLARYLATKRADPAAAAALTPITHIDIFDFDGTLFHSPNPNLDLWKRVEDALRDPGAPESAKHKLLVEKVADGGLGWYQSIETLLPPLVTSAGEFSDKSAKFAAKAPAAPPRLVCKRQNYFITADTDILLRDTNSADFIFSDRTVLEDSTKDTPAYAQHPRALFEKAQLSDFINAKVLEALQASATDPTHLTIVLTGRNILFTRIVQEILHACGVEADDVKMKPLVIPVGAAHHLEGVVREGAFNPITTLGIKEEYITQMLTYYASGISVEGTTETEDFSEVPHVRMFEDRVHHIGRFEKLLGALRDRPLAVCTGGLPEGTVLDRSAFPIGATIQKPHEKFLVESFALVPLISAARASAECEEKIPDLPLSRRDVRRRFTFEVIHVTDRGQRLPTHIELAVIAHLQGVHNTVLFDLCALCCRPRGGERAVGERDEALQCSCAAGEARPNEFVERIASSREAFIRDLS